MKKDNTFILVPLKEKTKSVHKNFPNYSEAGINLHLEYLEVPEKRNKSAKIIKVEDVKHHISYNYDEKEEFADNKSSVDVVDSYHDFMEDGNGKNSSEKDREEVADSRPSQKEEQPRSAPPPPEKKQTDMEREIASLSPEARESLMKDSNLILLNRWKELYPELKIRTLDKHNSHDDVTTEMIRIRKEIYLSKFLTDRQRIIKLMILVVEMGIPYFFPKLQITTGFSAFLKNSEKEYEALFLEMGVNQLDKMEDIGSPQSRLMWLIGIQLGYFIIFQIAYVVVGDFGPMYLNKILGLNVDYKTISNSKIMSSNHSARSEEVTKPQTMRGPSRKN